MATTTVLGWRWCPAVYDYCPECQRFKTGVWRYFYKQAQSSKTVCGECADALGKEDA